MTYISAERRKKSATVRVKDANGKERDKFPIDSKKTAKSAVRLLGHAKPPLSTSQKQHVLAEAKHFGVKPKSDVLHSKKSSKK